MAREERDRVHKLTKRYSQIVNLRLTRPACISLIHSVEGTTNLGAAVHRRSVWLIGLVTAVLVSHAGAETGASAAFLLPACRLYLQNADQGQRLRLERDVCIGTTETVLRLHRERRAGSSVCPPDQVTLEAAVRTEVDVTRAAVTLIAHWRGLPSKRSSRSGAVEHTRFARLDPIEGDVCYA